MRTHEAPPHCPAVHAAIQGEKWEVESVSTVSAVFNGTRAESVRGEEEQVVERAAC
jgi:hypothetical protein